MRTSTAQTQLIPGRFLTVGDRVAWDGRWWECVKPFSHPLRVTEDMIESHPDRDSVMLRDGAVCCEVLNPTVTLRTGIPQECGSVIGWHLKAGETEARVWVLELWDVRVVGQW